MVILVEVLLRKSLEVVFRDILDFVLHADLFNQLVVLFIDESAHQRLYLVVFNNSIILSNSNGLLLKLKNELIKLVTTHLTILCNFINILLNLGIINIHFTLYKRIQCSAVMDVFQIAVVFGFVEFHLDHYLLLFFLGQMGGVLAHGSLEWGVHGSRELAPFVIGEFVADLGHFGLI